MMSTRISHLPDNIVVDEHIVLRPKSAASFDEFALVAAASRDHLLPWMPWAKNVPDKSSVEHYEQAELKKANDEECNWDIVIDGRLVGAIGLHKRETTGNILEIGYWLASTDTGKGVVTKCVSTLIDIIFALTTAPSIEIGCDKANLKSAAIPERLGFKLDREVTAETPKYPTGCGLYFAITREQWENNNT